MADPLEQQLVWDISAVLGSIQEVDAALQSVVADFTAGLTAAVTELGSTPLTVDTSELTSSITDAVTAISEPIVVDGDTSQLDAAIADATDSPRDIPLDADPAELTSAITEATSDPVTVAVQGDVSEAAASIDALNTSPVTVDVDADTSQAQDQLDALGTSATSAVSGSGGGEGGLHGVETAVLGVEAAAGAAQGEAHGFASALGSVSTEAAAAATAGVAYVGFLTEAVSLAADAQAQQRRFNEVFGESAEIVEEIDVGGLKTNLEELGKQSGTTTADLEASASRIGLLGQASGAAGPEVAKTASDVLGLSAALSVSNPRFGDAATVADTVSRALSTGRTRSLIPYGISLSQNAILQEALNQNVGKTKDTLTGYDKLVAGLTLALQQQGDTLGTKYANGIQNAQVQLRALKVDVEETLVAVGGPLLAPVTQSLQDLVPVAEQVGVVLGKLGGDVLPLLSAITPVLTPLAGLLGLVGDGLEAIGPAGVAVGVALAIIVPDLVLVTAGFSSATVTATAFGVALDFATGPVGITIGVLAALGAATHLFGGSAKEAGTDTSQLVGIFDETGDSANSLQQRIAALTGGLEDYLKQQLTQGPVAQQGQVALHAFGNSYGELSEHLQQSTADFFTWYDSQRAAGPITDDTHKAIIKLSEVLLDSRDALEVSAEAQIHNAVQTGVLTKAQADAAIKQTAVTKTTDDMTKGDKDYLSALKLLAPVIDANNKKTEETTFAQFKASDANKALVTAVRAGAIVLSDAKDVATQYNITQDQATEIIQNTESAMDRATASTVTRTQAYRDLVGQIASGTIGEIDAQFALQQMGFSADGAAAAYKALSSQISDAVKSIVGNLPSASDAAKDWQSEISDAFKQAADDAKNHTGSVKDDLATLAADSDPAKFAANLVAQAGSVVKFEANLKTLISEGLGNLAGFIAQQPFDVAGPLADKLAGDESKAKLVSAAVKLSEAVTGPQAQAFFDENASALGLDVGTQLANGVVVGGAQVGDAVEGVGAGLAARFHPDFTVPVDDAVRAAAAALAKDPTIGQAAGNKGIEILQGFEQQFGPVTAANGVSIALKGAHDAIQNDPTLAAAAKQKGDDTKSAFDPDIKGKAHDQFTTGADGITNVGQLAVQAGKKGYDVGVAFDSGLVEGLNQEDGRSRISGAAAGLGALIESSIKAQLGIKSPSTVGIQLGRDVISGITIGLGNSGALAAAGQVVGNTISAAGTSAVSSIVAGFNDSATLNAAIVTLQSLIARAGARSSSTATNNAAQQQLNQFISSAVSSLPGSTAAISAFSSGISSALSKQTSAFTAYRKSVHDMRADQADVTKLTNETAAAYGTLLAAQQRLEADTAAHAGKQTIEVDKQNLQDATSAFDSLKGKLDSATQQFDKSVDDFNSKSKGLKSANTQLDKAEDPGTFTQSLNRRTQQEKQFQADIAKLVKLGDTDLAQQLVTAGVDSAGALAHGLAGSKAKAKAAEAAVDHAKAFSDSYQHFLETTFAPKAAATVTSAITPPQGVPVGVPNVITAQGPTVQLAAQGILAPPPSSAPQVLELDLSITLPNGTIVKAKKTLDVPRPSPKTTKTRVKTSVVGKVNA